MKWILIWLLLTGANYTDALSPWLAINRSEARDSAESEHILDLIESYLQVAYGKPLKDIMTPVELQERAHWLEEADKLLVGIDFDELSEVQKDRWFKLNLRIESMADMFQARSDQLMGFNRSESRKLQESA